VLCRPDSFGHRLKPDRFNLCYFHLIRKGVVPTISYCF
jgi:hypothetical protein